MVIKIPEVEKATDVADIIRQQSVTTRPIEDIGIVVLDHKQITITQALLDSLLENNCAIITCDSRRMPVGLMLPLCGNTIQQCSSSPSMSVIVQVWTTLKCTSSV